MPITSLYETILEAASLCFTDTILFGTDSWGLEQVEQRNRILIAGGLVVPMCVGLNCSFFTQFGSVKYLSVFSASLGFPSQSMTFSLTWFVWAPKFIWIISYKLRFWRLGRVVSSVALHLDSVHKYVYTQAQSRIKVQSDYGSEHFLPQISS